MRSTIRPTQPADQPLPSRPAGRPPIDLARVRACLRGLDRAQRAAVTHGDGPSLVLAGPGTGKTEVVTRRIAWLIATRRARPAEILALTFTARAADEMQARVDALVAYGQADTAILTFHALGDRLLREHGLEMGLPAPKRVVGRAEAVMLLQEHLFELGLARYRPLADPGRFLGAMVDLFGRAKGEGIQPDDYAAYARELAAGAEAARATAEEDGARAVAEALLDEAAGHAELARAYERYDALLREASLVDHGDQVALAVRLLRERPAVRAAVRGRFRYVLVDEAQDTDPVQAELVELVAGAAGNVTFVGDDDQAIYGFRGGAVGTMLDLPRAYPGLARVVLAVNHRSRAPIVEAAHRLVRHNDPHRLEVLEGLDKSLRAARRARAPRPVTALTFATPADEADHIAEDIRVRVAAGMSPRSFAVLVRTHAAADPVLRSLRVRDLPVRFSGPGGLLAHDEVRETLALLRVLADPGSSIDLYAVATAAPYALGGADMSRILERARRRRRSLWETCGEIVEQPGLVCLASASRGALERLVADLEASLDLAHRRPAGEVLYAHLRRSGRLAGLVSAAERGDDAPLERVARVFAIIRDQSEIVADARVAVLVPHLRGLLDHADPSDGREPTGPEDAVSVLTVHQAKGLEFDVVYVVGLAEGRFPMRGRRDRLELPEALLRRADALGPEDAALAEERRLMFVAMTRARDELVLTCAEARGTGTGRRLRPSTFIAEALDRAPLQVVAPAAALAALREQETAAKASPVGHARRERVRAPLELSFSQLDDYLACPLRYRLRHDLGVPTPPHHALVLGNAIHQAVAADLAARAKGRPLAEEAVLDVFATHWRSEGFLSREHEDARFQAGQEALRRFHAAPPFPPEREIVAVERPFAVRLGRDVVRGRYDLLGREADGVVITDHKSSDVRDPRAARERARASLQLQVYALAHEAETGELPAALELHFVESGVVGRVAPDRARLSRTAATVAEAAEGIRAGRFEARPGFAACGLCPYREICPSAA